VFIHTGSGTDAIDVSVANGNNVLDGGTGSNFLTGGTGNDTFYLDDRSPTATTWSTIANFRSGDSATVWGVTSDDFTLTWLDGQGAPGYTGLTAVFQKDDVPESAITLAGFTSADLNNGNLTVSWGRTADQTGIPGATFMHISAS
jgi:Ca2+-binding RTX toxin-like protein